MRSMLAAGAAIVLAACASAPEPYGWPALTRGDVEAAYTFLNEDHPGASPEAGDVAFRDNLETARRLALTRASSVDTFEGYAAVLAGFANAIGDRHVGTLPRYRADTRTWAGLIVALRGDRYRVVHDARGEGASLVGAALVSCDGAAAADFAREALGGFRAVWSVAAQRAQSAPFLLIDDGNPFAPAPKACVFEADGKQTSVELSWRTVARTELSPLIRAARNQGASGYGVRDFAGGVWISLEDFEAGAPAVVEAVRAIAERLRASPRVVLDLRGNGGGNDMYGRYIAETLFGEARVLAVLGPLPADGAGCPSAWRASPRNEAYLRHLRATITDEATLRYIDAALAQVEAARREGRDFGVPVQCETTLSVAAPDDAPPQAARGRIILLTDNTCFSSCLSVTDKFRRLGALHVGQATNANTHYAEERVETLPSGLSIFAVLQAVIPDAPLQYGPFEPALAYDGDMADTAALEAWVAREVR